MSDSETGAGTSGMPTATGNVATDTRDMVGIHNTFRRALGDAPGQIGAVREGDRDRAQQLGDYLSEILWLLEVHHAGEDELLYPLLEQRAPEHLELFRQMGAQHATVHTSLEAAKTAAKQFGASGSVADGQAAAVACQALLAATEGHLREEEEMVLPIAARVISPPEWGAMPPHALSQYRGDRILATFWAGVRVDARRHSAKPVGPPTAARDRDVVRRRLRCVRERDGPDKARELIAGPVHRRERNPLGPVYSPGNTIPH